MKTRQIFIITVLLLYRGLLPAATNGFSPELLSYHLQTTVESYDKVGRKNPKWDAEAKACLKTFAEIRASTNGVPSNLLEQLRTNLLHVVSLNCDDPMIRYLHTRFVLGGSQTASELAPVYADVASALEKSHYPAIRKFYPRLWVYRIAVQAGEKNDSKLLEQAASFLAEALQDESMPAPESATACNELMSLPWWSDPTRWNCYRILEPSLTNNWKDTGFAQLAKGQAYLSYGWQARGRGYADTVPEQGWKLLADRLQTAAEALEKAWELDPKDASICLEMMRVELGQGKGMQRLETWFNRGMNVNPGNWNLCYAKLEYLRPRWFGTLPEMIKFGWECMTNSNWSGDVRLGLANAHYEVAREMKDKETMYAYLAKTNVWADIRYNFEYFLKLYPNEVGYRHNYARFAGYAGDHEEFMRQVKLFPSTNFAYFGGVDRFNQQVEHAQQHIKKERK